MTDRQIEYFYSAHSAYAYLGAPRLAQIAAATGSRVVHRPFDFRPVVQAAGGQEFAARTEAHVAYFFGRELRRWAQWRGLAMIDHRPTHHDNPLAKANGMIIASDDPDSLSFAILQAHWRDDADIADDTTLVSVAQACGQDGAALLSAASSEAIQAQHRTNTEEAIARNVFGSPTYFAQGDMFYGQDRLEMLARAISRPFDP